MVVSTADDDSSAVPDGFRAGVYDPAAWRLQICGPAVGPAGAGRSQQRDVRFHGLVERLDWEVPA